MAYRHTQWSGTMGVIALVAAGAIVVSSAMRPEGWPWIDVVLGLVVLVGVIGSRLSVSVDTEAVTTEFGLGWPRRRVLLADIGDVEAYENPWWTGWGIRKISHGWMFNNSGRHAVHLELRSGRTFRIGTDDQQGLVAAISRSVERSS